MFTILQTFNFVVCAGINIGNRWNDCFDLGKDHMADNSWSYNDFNVMLSCMGAKKKEEEDFMIQNVETFIR